jgi:hypothetical protein
VSGHIPELSVMSSRQGYFLLPEKKVTKETGPRQFLYGSLLNPLFPFHFRSEPKISKEMKEKKG